MLITSPRIAKLPLGIVGSSKFGRYPKISAEKTFNFYVSEGWNVPTPGHKKVLLIDSEQEGRGAFTSIRGKLLITVIGDGVWIVGEEIKKIDREISIADGPVENIARKVGQIETFTGDVFMDENDAKQVAICDKKNIYIYDYTDGSFEKAVVPGSDKLDFLPGYVVFQNGYFIASAIIPSTKKPEWRLSNINNGKLWPADSSHIGEFQTKSDDVQACIRVPGKGSLLFVMGSSVTEAWQNRGYKLFPYYRDNNYNIDYGCVNQSTIAESDEFVIWLGRNEKSAPVIMYSDGGPPRTISTDGINFDLAQRSNPEDSYGFIFKIDGHLFYQLTLVTDKITYLYDFNTNKIYFLANEKMENHIAKKVVFFAGDYYFISLVDGDLYRLSGALYTADGETVPRVRITNTIRKSDSTPFVANKMGFTIEQGESGGLQRVDMSLSKNGGVSFGNILGRELNARGRRKNEFHEFNLGYANELTVQLRFWGDGRFVCSNGFMEVY